MARMGRPGLTDQQKLELWQRWKAGEGLSEIGLALGKHAGSIHGVVSLKGGIAPDARTRSSRQLSLLEREHISRSLASNKSIRTIAGDLLRSPSTISREVKRNGGPVCYRAMIADNMAWTRAERPKHCILAQRPELKQMVVSKLALNWSPEQVSGWLKREYSGDLSMLSKKPFKDVSGTMSHNVSKCEKMTPEQRVEWCKRNHPEFSAETGQKKYGSST